MKQLETVIHNPTGLHARPAKIFVNAAKKFSAKIMVSNGEKKVSAKSMISLLTLGVEYGTTIQIEAEGDDENEAITALGQLIADGLGESELIERENGKATKTTASQPPAPQVAEIPRAKNSDPNLIIGIPGAPGIAIGPVFQMKKMTLTIKEDFNGVVTEKNLLQKAIDQAKAQIAQLSARMRGRNADSEASIFDVHLEILEDAGLLDGVFEKIGQKFSAPRAWQNTIDEQASEVASLKDPTLAARAADLKDVGYRVQCIMHGVDADANTLPNDPVIVVANDLSPSDTASLDRDRVLGFITAGGGPTSHTAIIARALSLPAIVSAGPKVLSLKNESKIILNGDDGQVILNPTDEQIGTHKTKQKINEDSRIAARAASGEPAITKDGHQMEIVANIGGPEDAAQALGYGAEGVGLFRTEFLFLERDDPPTEEEQFIAYKTSAENMGGRPVIIRTLDIGGDKQIPYIDDPHEENPFLGVRGVRLCLDKPDLFREQLRAILKAAKYGKLRVMFPMVADISEWRAARALVEEISAELQAPKVELGIMIEVPSAAIMADIFAEEVDFFSIGTNDLTQYTMAMDRMNPRLAGKSDGLHPSVLRLIHTTANAAHKAGKWVGVCGELGADKQAVPILIGLGVDELSVTVPAIPTLKAQIRELNYQDTKQLAEKALACATAQQVRALK